LPRLAIILQTQESCEIQDFLDAVFGKVLENSRQEILAGHRGTPRILKNTLPTKAYPLPDGEERWWSNGGLNTAVAIITHSRACRRSNAGIGFPRDLRIKDVGVQVSPIGPANRAEFGIHGQAGELAAIAQWGKDALETNQFAQVDDPLDAIFKAEKHLVSFQDPSFHNVL